MASLIVLPASAKAQLAGRSPNQHSAVSAFCAKIPASKVSSTIGEPLTLFGAVVKNGSLECIYFGKAPASVSHPITEVVISMQPGIPAAQLATRVAAEARISSESPKGVKLTFASLPSVGPTAFSWAYAKALNGGQLVGVANNKGTTGYGVVLGGPAKTFGSAAGHVPVAERLLSLDFTAWSIAVVNFVQPIRHASSACSAGWVAP